MSEKKEGRKDVVIKCFSLFLPLVFSKIFYLPPIPSCITWTQVARYLNRLAGFVSVEQSVGIEIVYLQWFFNKKMQWIKKTSGVFEMFALCCILIAKKYLCILLKRGHASAILRYLGETRIFTPLTKLRQWGTRCSHRESVSVQADCTALGTHAWGFHWVLQMECVSHRYIHDSSSLLLRPQGLFSHILGAFWSEGR